jgi:hypothetical protein
MKNKTLMSVKYLAICPAIRKSRCVSIITQMWVVGSIILQNFSVNKAVKVDSN